MRKKIYLGSREEGEALLRRAPVVHIAGQGAQGQPVLRTVHGVVHEGALFFHSGPRGEKVDLVGARVVAQAMELVAHVPSHFLDPRRACPATTYYLSAQVDATLLAVEDLEEKARALQALMARFQPEGGHVPITAQDPLYRKALAGLLVCRLPLDGLVCKAKLAQNKSPEQRQHLLESLWRRGLPGDPRAAALLREANPDTPCPPFLQGPPQVELLPCLWRPEQLEEAAALLRPQYWHQGMSEARRLARLQAPSHVVGARCERSGELVGVARAVSDGAGAAWFYDVCVREGRRGRGLGRRLLGLLLDHPQVRGVRQVWLATRDAQAFYARLGFVVEAQRRDGAWLMCLRQA